MIRYRDEQVTVFESALFRTTSTVVQTADLVLVVDPTWLPGEIETIRQWVNAIRNDRPLYLLFTHSDYDHILGWGAFPDAITIASNAFVQNADAGDQLESIRQFDDANYIRRDYPIAYPKIDLVIDRDGQEVLVGNTRLTFYLSPGHNPDGLFTFLDPPGIWLAGDYLSNIEFPYIYYSGRRYEEQLRRVPALIDRHQPRLLVPGHGDPTGDMNEVQHRADNDLRYIRDLRADLANGIERPAEAYRQPILFPRIMNEFHQKNIQLLRREMASR